MAAHEIDIPTVGRIVHVRTRNSGCRPAIVTRVWSPNDPKGAIQLTVFTDWSNDAREFPQGQLTGLAWVTSSTNEASKPEHAENVGQYWHWPERA